MLPEGWNQLRLGNIFKFKNGLNGDSSLYGSGAKFVNVMDVFRGPRLRHHEIIGEMIATAKQLDEFGIKFGDVLFNRTSETDDEIAFATVYLDDKPAVFGGFVIRARPTDVSLTPEFCTYVFQSAFIRRSMIRLGQGAIRSNIGQGDLTTVPIKFPPIAEQSRIAEILSTWDRAIAVQEQLVVNARAQKKALMQTLLTAKKRLPGFKGEWKTRKFVTIASLAKERVDTTSLPPGARGIELEHIESETGSLLRFAEANQQLSLKTPFNTNHVLYGKLRPYLRKFLKPTFSGVASTEIWVLIASRKLCSPEFLYFLVQSPGFEAVVDMSAGSKMPRADWDVVKDAPFLIPELDEQSAISNVLEASEILVRNMQARVRQLQQEKSALMQQLLTGKRRVKVEAQA